MLQVRRYFAALLLIVLASGCGESYSLRPVSGTVTYNGKPVEGASLVFMPDTSGQPFGTGVTDAAGKYTISTNGKPGAVAGNHKITIVKLRQTAGGDSSGDAAPSPEDMKAQQMKGPPQSKHELPEKYSFPQGSGLTANVGEKEVFDFQLSD